MTRLVIVLMLAWPAGLVAQTAPAVPAPMPASVSVPASISVGMHVGTLPSGYDDGGRRDPFTSLVVPRRTAGAGAARVRTGLSGQPLSDIVVRGVMRAGAARFAILETPGKKSFVAHVKDKLLDATVRSIDDAGVVFLEDDGSGLPPSEVRKQLKSASDDAGEEDR
jgi:hypothetical protein